MSAYVIVELNIHDPKGFEKYKELVAPTIAAYSGKYIVRGGKTDVLEGSWTPGRLVILEFESMDRARAWFNSAEYAPIKRLRLETAESKLVLVEGLT